MRFKRVVPLAGVVAVSAAAVALAAHPKVDPAEVPTGFLTAHSQLNDIPFGAVRKVMRKGRADLFVEHRRLAAGEATPFVTHPGPVFVMVAAGTVTNEQASGGGCATRTYVKDRGFAASRSAHRMTAGSAGADLYLVHVAPRLTGPTQKTVGTPSACA